MYSGVSELGYFESLVAEPAELPLLETASSLAHVEEPGLDLAGVQTKVDNLSDRLAARCRDESTELSRLEALTRFFYQEVQFAGNRNDYYDPRNSFIHYVLETRRGIPISLAIVFIELSNAIGIDAQGVSFPGHFLVRLTLHDGSVILDPFSGHSLTREDIDERVDPFRQSMLHASARELPVDAFLQPASNHEILMRMLRNLQEIYRQQNMPDQLERVRERMKILQAAIAQKQNEQPGASPD